MKTILLDFVPVILLSIASAILFFPAMIKLSPYLGLVDKPNNRKVHTSPVPAIGGFVIVLCLLMPALFSGILWSFIITHKMIYITLIILMVTGLLDDRWDLPVKLRLIVQLGCAIVIALAGIRLTSLYGFMGIHELPESAQYFLTVLIIMGVVNAFNLIDGIDGLVGSLGIINILVLIVMSIVSHHEEWLLLLLPLAAALSVFLKYNWKPAKVFMGDSGSLTIGFIVSTSGIYFIQSAQSETLHLAPVFIVLITACCMVPVLDSIRVYLTRMWKGKSAFSADKTHLHHLLIHHHLMHSNATTKIIRLQLVLILFSTAAICLFSIAWVIISQVFIVIIYIYTLQLMTHFYRWYRFIKKMEIAN
ncbi:glycosyltransferase family 4 protein [Pedobacter cryoconitis]|uniref:glycosyltransferase family 4 protein n=1 Tax=Pedobacter cryoconitis TaxID=188932 RepID=UPI001614B08B|nr:MraY family glycosyltransferase [Pedobacter cryoconitis]MBB5647177.1 UDP-GlcNAc:undecaprenyl-phosphate GlcNAc-1-phosphate transferase [Pedobacter cryoconitis]